MRTVTVLLAITLLLNLGGCRESRKASQPIAAAPTDKSENKAPVAPPTDNSEILIRHLLRRVSELTDEGEKMKTASIKADTACLNEEFAILEGRPSHRPALDPVAHARAFSNSLDSSLRRAIQNLLDSEAFVAEHNLNHPEAPWENSNDVLRLMCGDCLKDRATREVQLREEAVHK